MNFRSLHIQKKNYKIHFAIYIKKTFFRTLFSLFLDSVFCIFIIYAAENDGNLFNLRIFISRSAYLYLDLCCKCTIKRRDTSVISDKTIRFDLEIRTHSICIHFQSDLEKLQKKLQNKVSI